MIDMSQISERLKSQIDDMVSSELVGIQGIVESVDKIQAATQNFIQVLERFSEKIDAFKSGDIKKGGNFQLKNKSEINTEKAVPSTGNTTSEETTKTDIIRKMFKDCGPLKTSEVLEKSGKYGLIDNVPASDLSRVKGNLRFLLHDLGKMGELTKADKKRSTPWVPTDKLLQRVTE